ncbi:MAG: NUDIX hydrolase [Clostridia bacterium]|nr:NUDIX hydrolase [Clostridia bacterium]
MNKREVWDAYDANGNLLGFDLYRDEAEQIPHGIYHAVADIITVTKDGCVLITQRDPRKRFGLKWEFSGGSVLKGETPLMGAVRELSEETGIHQKPENMTLLVRMAFGNSLYHIYVNAVENSAVPVTLQEGETVAYRFVPAEELKNTVQEDSFALPVREKFSAYEEALFAYIESLK